MQPIFILYRALEHSSTSSFSLALYLIIKTYTQVIKFNVSWLKCILHMTHIMRELGRSDGSEVRGRTDIILCREELVKGSISWHWDLIIVSWTQVWEISTGKKLMGWPPEIGHPQPQVAGLTSGPVIDRLTSFRKFSWMRSMYQWVVSNRASN